MMTRKIIIGTISVLAFSVALAGGKEDKRICTIGWYKNNGFDSWYDTCVGIDGAAACDALNDLMYTTGAHAGDVKNAAADQIVRDYVGYGNETCDAATGDYD